MTTPVLSLEEFFLTSIEIKVEDPSGIDSKEPGLFLDYEVQRHVDDPLRYRLFFSVGVDPEIRDGQACSVACNAQILGFFSFPEEMPVEKREQMIRYNGSLILYGILRGQVAAFSGCFPTGKLALPSFNMVDAMKEIEERKRKEAIEAQAKATGSLPKAEKS